MNKVMQTVAGSLRDTELAGWRRWCDRLIVLDRLSDVYQADPEIPLVGALTVSHKAYRWWINQRRPYITYNRPHIGGWHTAYKVDARRISVNSHACTRLTDVPFSRWPQWKLSRPKWQVKKIRNVLVAPPNKIIYYVQGTSADEWAQQQRDWFIKHGADVRIRPKTGKGKGARYQTLWQDLAWADLVVSYGSAITSEAFWYGKKVINFAPCSTWVCGGQDLESWQDPQEPESRSQWFEHVAWTQFSDQESQSGEAQELTWYYQGDPLTVQTADLYYGKIK